MSEYKIGEKTFLDIAGQIPRPKPELTVVKRPGVNGAGFWRTGVRGSEFDVTTTVDQPNMTTARAEYAEYCDMIGDDEPFEMVWYDLDLTTLETLKVVVLNVELEQLRQIANAVGGLNGPSGALLVCRWTLFPIFA